MKNVDWQKQGLDNPKTRLGLQTSLLGVLTEIGKCNKKRFKLGEIYQLWDDVEITFKIIASGCTSNQRSIYNRIESQKSDIITGLNSEEGTIGLEDLEITDKERNSKEASQLVPQEKNIEAVQKKRCFEFTEAKKQEKDALLEKRS